MPTIAGDVATNAGFGNAVSQDSSRQATPLSVDLSPQPDAVPPQIQQVTRPSSVSLDADSLQGLFNHATYNASAQASAAALSQTLRLHDALVRQLGQ